MKETQESINLVKHLDICEYSQVEIDSEQLEKLLEYLNELNVFGDLSLVSGTYPNMMTLKSMDNQNRVELIKAWGLERERLIGLAKEDEGYEWFYFYSVYPQIDKRHSYTQNEYASELVKQILARLAMLETSFS